MGRDVLTSPSGGSASGQSAMLPMIKRSPSPSPKLSGKIAAFPLRMRGRSPSLSTDDGEDPVQRELLGKGIVSPEARELFQSRLIRRSPSPFNGSEPLLAAPGDEKLWMKARVPANRVPSLSPFLKTAPLMAAKLPFLATSPAPAAASAMSRDDDEDPSGGGREGRRGAGRDGGMARAVEHSRAQAPEPGPGDETCPVSTGGGARRGGAGVRVAEAQLSEAEDPWAALERLRRRPESDEFVYLLPCRRNGSAPLNPYHVRVVPHSEAHGKAHLTLSLRGVTHASAAGRVVEFTPLERWKREARLFGCVARIPIFATYARWKPFKVCPARPRALGAIHARPRALPPPSSPALRRSTPALRSAPPPACGRTRRVRLVRGEGRGVSD